MITAITAFLGTLAGKATLATLGAPVALFLLGKVRNSGPYKSALAWVGRVVFNAFAALSGVGTSKLGKHIWMPIEGLITDLLFIVGEQATAGLRADNVEKLEAQVERLEAVGSVTRAAALEKKVVALTKVARIIGRGAGRKQ